MMRKEEHEHLIRIASSYAVENGNDAIYPAHIFKALMHKDMGMIQYIESDLDKDYYYLVEWADCEMKMLPRRSRMISDVELSDESAAVFQEADNYRLKLGLEETDNLCILASIVTPGVGFTFNSLKTLPLTPDEILGRFGRNGGSDETYINKVSKSSGHSNKKDTVSKYCINRNEDALNGMINPVIGFEREIASCFEILGRKTKSNLLITGESGVGKTSLINGFVLRLTSGNIPTFLQNAVAYELDLAALTSAAINKIEIEDRFRNLMDELESFNNAILIVESVNKLMDKQSSLCGVGDILKQELSKGSIPLICTASTDEFTKRIETDKEFVGKFEKISLEEPDFDKCFRIVRGAIDVFENYHDLKVSDDVITEAIRLSKRYMTEKALPDSVFDLIDRTMALIRTMNDVSENDIASVKNKLSGLKQNLNQMTEQQLMTELNWINYELFNKISCLLTAQIDDDTDFSKIETPELRINYLETVLSKLESLTRARRVSVESSDLFAVVAKQTGIPLGKVQSREKDRLTNAESILKKRVVGQDHAIKTLLDSIYESRSGLNKKGQPMGSFFFLGPTGTGKTELSKALAEFLFQDESALIRFDMSEFKEEHSVALLYGAPPGYVGYEEGGLLVNKIRQRPYSVVLFDEIEKAHKSVFDLFLQILDEGKLHDRLGRVGDFSNALILFTSNIGSKFIMESFAKGVIPKNNELMDIMQGYFRPEFLGRLTEIVPFSPITEDIVSMIFNIHLKALLKSLDEQHISLKIDDEAKRSIALSGFSPEFGARPIIGVIRKKLRRPLSKLIISGKVISGDEIWVKLGEDGVLFEVNGVKI